MLDQGNTTTYEWTYGEPPLSITEPDFILNVEEDEDDNDHEKNEVWSSIY